MGQKGWGIVGFAAVVVVGFFSWEYYFSPEARVSRALHGAADAAEDVDADGFLAFFSNDYADFVHSDLSALVDNVRSNFERVDRLNVTIQSMDVEFSGADARARFDLVVVAHRGDDRFIVVGTPLQPEKLTAILRETPEGYRIAGVERFVAYE